jgi:hypothetical protein
MKWIIILFLFGCSNYIVKERLVKDKVVGIYKLETGYCEYMVQPKSNYTIYMTDTCRKYEMGDYIYRIERYEVLK